jgi:hypothetical protein
MWNQNNQTSNPLGRSNDVAALNQVSIPRSTSAWDAGTSSSQARPNMMKPPQVITTKDLSYLKDGMSWTLLAMKKCAHLAQECTDQSIRQVIDQIGKMHQRHYNMLLQHCQNNNAAAMKNVPQPQQQSPQKPQ